MLSICRTLSLLDVKIFAQVNVTTRSVPSRLSAMTPVLLVVRYEAGVGYGGLTRRMAYRGLLLLVALGRL